MLRVMSNLLNQASYVEGIYAPVPDELHATDLVVHGEIPRELHGVFAQNSPNAAMPPVGYPHWFDGDGMVHAVHMENGKATYRNRWIQTKKLAADRAAGRQLRPGILMPFDTSDATPEPDTANTDLVWHGGDLLALHYLGGEPYRLDPVTLETRGIQDCGGKLDMGVAAHPKVCPTTGDMMFIDFGFRDAPWLQYGVVNREGTLTHRLDIDIPQPTFMHDIGITANHTIFLDLPMTWDQAALNAGKRRIRFEKDTPSRFGVVSRHGSDVQWFETEACYAYHTINAWESTDPAGNTVVHMTGCRIADPIPTTPHETEPTVPRLTFLRLAPFLWEWTFNLGTGAVTSKQLDDVPTEFPRMNDLRLGTKTRYSWNPRVGPAPTLVFDGLIKYDAQGPARTHTYEAAVGGEAVFAPRAGGEAEDDGWMLVYVHDGEGSELRILDAATMDLAARVELPRRVPFGFHAAFVPGEEL
jgi:carotenoid cleavage dioxygenase-like enzyme